MTPPSRPIDRRTFLGATGATAVAASIAGCSQLGIFSQSRDGLVLGPPENHGRVDAENIPWPSYGESLPEVSIPAPLHDREVSTPEFADERHVMVTFIFTSCTAACVGLTSSLRHVQADAIENGYADELAFLVITFDPEHDTREVLEAYGEDHGVDFDVGNWYFLRPETPADARDVVTDTFGVEFERADGEEPGSGDGNESGMDGNESETGGSESGMEDTGDGMEGDDEMAHDDHARHFVHSNLVLLANKDGLVERAYNGQPPAPNTTIEDAKTVVEGW